MEICLPRATAADWTTNPDGSIPPEWHLTTANRAQEPPRRSRGSDRPHILATGGGGTVGAAFPLLRAARTRGGSCRGWDGKVHSWLHCAVYLEERVHGARLFTIHYSLQSLFLFCFVLFCLTVRPLHVFLFVVIIT